MDDDAEVEAWEAELEGELNEFEVVSSKDGNEDPTDDMTEDQIQEMLDAEDGTSSNDSLKRKWKTFIEKWLMLPMMPYEFLPFWENYIDWKFISDNRNLAVA